VASQVETLLQTLERSQQLVAAIKTDEAAAQQQQATLAELVEQGRALAAETAERLKQARAVSDDLDRAAALKEVVLAELAHVQAKQRDAVAQSDVADDQIQRADAMVKQLEQRCAQLLHSEKHVAAVEGRLDELGRSAEAVEHKIASLADQEVLVQAVKAEVENIRQISSRSKADLQFVSEHRNDVSELRGKVEDLIGRVHDTDGKIEMIESRRKMVEEVQARANSIVHVLDDINVNLEMLSEQRAVVDHVGEKLARLDYTVQEAHNTLRALQREREVAERIEQGIKALRARSSASPVARRRRRSAIRQDRPAAFRPRTVSAALCGRPRQCSSSMRLSRAWAKRSTMKRCGPEAATSSASARIKQAWCTVALRASSHADWPSWAAFSRALASAASCMPSR
jgi:myosin heavy subunit